MLPSPRPRPGAVCRTRRALLGVLVASAGTGSLSRATPAIGNTGTWPSRSIRLVVPQAPGGVADLVARYVSERLARRLGVAWVVENRPGASGVIGSDHVARADPDGHALLFATLSSHVLVPHLSPRLPYDPERDFVPVVSLFRSIKALWVNATLPVHDIDGLVAHARAHPARLNHASGGAASSNHVDAELLRESERFDSTHVPYNGPAAGLRALANGEAHWMVVSITAGLPLARAGHIRPLAVFADRRSPLLPGVRTAAEQGRSTLDLSAWMGVLGPARMPAAVVTRLNAEAVALLREPETRTWADAQALEIAGGSAPEFAAATRAERARWGDTLRRFHLGGQ